ncbi:MAG: EthD domain-containing protein [Ardenticatenaceae bacterium]|nr:EthD domain-containing protein [Ardenticatenaceae bacterium]HBY96897.1 hypothetical protein [Chloroflexota bacterium]
MRRLTMSLLSPYDTFDGTAEMWWDSVAEMEAAFETEIGQQAGADADAHCSERYHIYTEEHVII